MLSPPPIRVLHLIDSLGLGGAERLLCTNLAHIDPHKFQNTVVYLFEQDDLRDEIESMGVECEGLALRSVWDWPKAATGLRRSIAKIRPDLIHTNLVKSDIYGRIVGRGLGIPVISTIHETPWGNPEFESPRYSLIRVLDSLTARHCVRTFVCVSKFSATTAQKCLGIAAQRTRLIYNSLDLDLFTNVTAEEVAAIRSEFQIPREEKVLLNVGRLVSQKGHRYLLMAFRNVLDNHPNMRLLIRGSGTLRFDLERMCRDLGVQSKVTFVEPLSNIRKLFAICDLFVFPSLYEGLGIALLEAMAMGKPCIASNIGPIPEVVEHGRNGLLVRPGDPHSLATAIAGLLENPKLCRHMGDQARQIVKERFDIRKNIKLLEKVYEEAMLSPQMTSPPPVLPVHSDQLEDGLR